MRRALLVLLATACVALAQGPQLTTITDHFDTTGPITVRATAAVTFETSDDYVILFGTTFTATTDSNGNLSISLPPNSGATPSGSYYTVSYSGPGLATHEIWIVPASATPVDLAAVRALQPPAASYVFAFAQILPPANCGSNEFIQWSGTSWGCATSAGGMSNPMTTAGDLIVGGTNGTPTRLAAGCAGCVLLGQGAGVAPAYVQDPEVQGLVASGSALSGNPVLVGGSDGTDVRTLSLDATGRANVNVIGTVPVSGTFWQATQPVSLASLPALAAGSNTIGAVTQAGSPWTTNLLDVGGTGITLGSKTSANSFPVVIASDQGAVPVSGTFWQATQPVSLASLPALAAGTNDIGSVDQHGTWVVGVSGNVSVVGIAADNTANSAAKLPVIPAVANSAAPTYTSGDQVPLSTDTGGNLRVTCANCGGGSGGTAMGDAGSYTQGTTSFTPVGGEYNSSPTSLTSGQAGAVLMTATRHLDVAVSDPLPAGANVIGGVTGSGTFTVGGTVTANAGSGTFNTQDAADGPAGAGTAATKSLLGGCVYNTTLPTLSNGQQAAAQCDSSGRQLVSIINSALAVTQSGAWNVGITNASIPVTESGAWSMAVSGNAAVVGTQASNSAVGNGLEVLAGRYDSSLPTLTNGNTALLETDVNGRLLIGALPSGSNSIGTVAQGSAGSTPWETSQTPTSSSAQGLTNFTPAFITSATTIDSAAGNLYTFEVWDSGTAACYLEFFNAASASVTLGTTTPIWVVALFPTSSNAFEVNSPPGFTLNFSTALSVAAVTAENGTTTCPASTAFLNAGYK